MKVVLLAGGFGTRISEESHLRPKPMVEIGGKPILWHIMKEYSHYGFNEFIICCGYKQHMIKEYFADYFLHNSDVTFDMQGNEMTVHNNFAEPWKVTCVDTGLNTMIFLTPFVQLRIAKVKPSRKVPLISTFVNFPFFSFLPLSFANLSDCCNSFNRERYHEHDCLQNIRQNRGEKDD